MKAFFLIGFLVGCATSQKEERRWKSLDWRLLNLRYEFNIHNCFNELRFCRIENKYDDCRQKHETCVTTETRAYKDLLRIKGY